MLRSSIEAFDTLNAPKNIELFSKHRVFSAVECRSRYEILMENYSKVLSIEANTMLEMANRLLLPAVMRYAGDLAASYNQLKTAGMPSGSMQARLTELSGLIENIFADIQSLQFSMDTACSLGDIPQQAQYLVEHVRPDMDALRAHMDAAEVKVDRSYWPIPTYTDLLHRM